MRTCHGCSYTWKPRPNSPGKICPKCKRQVVSAEQAGVLQASTCKAFTLDNFDVDAAVDALMSNMKDLIHTTITDWTVSITASAATATAAALAQSQKEMATALAEATKLASDRAEKAAAKAAAAVLAEEKTAKKTKLAEDKIQLEKSKVELAFKKADVQLVKEQNKAQRDKDRDNNRILLEQTRHNNQLKLEKKKAESKEGLRDRKQTLDEQITKQKALDREKTRLARKKAYDDRNVIGFNVNNPDVSNTEVSRYVLGEDIVDGVAPDVESLLVAIRAWDGETNSACPIDLERLMEDLKARRTSPHHIFAIAIKDAVDSAVLKRNAVLLARHNEFQEKAKVARSRSAECRMAFEQFYLDSYNSQPHEYAEYQFYLLHRHGLWANIINEWHLELVHCFTHGVSGPTWDLFWGGIYDAPEFDSNCQTYPTYEECGLECVAMSLW